MFEGISMVSLGPEVTIVSSDYEKKLTHYIDLSPEDSGMFNASFCLSARSIRALLPLPSAEQDAREYCHIQTFVLIDADKNYYTQRRDYTSYLLLFTYAGEGELTYRGCTCRLTENTGFLIDCREPHSYRTTGERWLHGDLHFTGGSSDTLYAEYQKAGSAVFTCSKADLFQTALETVLRRYSVLSPHRGFYVSNALSSLITCILEEHERELRTIPENYRYLIRYMENNYKKPLSLDQLASFANISKYHLTREFKRYTGYSPVDYLIELRISHARLLLQSTDIPAYRIGEMTGIPNEANFLRLFKKRTGETPGQYRAGNALHI